MLLRALAFCLLCCLLWPAQLQARTLVVSPSPDHSAQELSRACEMARPGDEIVIEAGLYIHPNGAIFLNQVQDVTIRGQGDVFIFSTDPNSSPVGLLSCSNIVLENLMLGHLFVRGGCGGSVVMIQSSVEVFIRNCVMHGSGLTAVESFDSRGILVQDSTLAGCTLAAVSPYNSQDTVLERCLIADNNNDYMESPLFYATDSVVKVVQSLIVANHSQSLITNDWMSPENLVIRDSLFVDNRFIINDAYARAQGNGNAMGSIGQACDADYIPLPNKDEPYPDMMPLAPVAERYRTFRQEFQRLESDTALGAQWGF